MATSQSQLTEAFHAFNTLSERLSGAYRELEGRVERLTAELVAARDQRLAELAAKERLANRLSRLLEALPAAVVVLDDDGKVSAANPSAVALFDIELIDQPWQMVTARHIQSVAAGGTELIFHDGRRVTLSTRELGSEPGRILVMQDVTETRRLQAQADRHERLSAMGEMTASLAHQIRTPLASALLYAGHLARPAMNETERLRAGERISARLRHLEGLVQDMLAYVRGGPQDQEPVSLHEVMTALRTSMLPQLNADQASLVVDVPPHLVLSAQRDALLGALANLVANALQAAGGGACVRIVAQDNGDAVSISVTDNGPGLSSGLEERIFEPFFTTRAQGTGLGLAIVRDVIQRHGGELHARNRRRSRGAEFIIQLPRANDARPLSAGAPWVPGATILTRRQDHE